MDKLIDHLFVFKGDGIIEDHYCSYSEFRKKQSKEVKHIKRSKKSIHNDEQQLVKKKLTYKEKQEYDNLEQEIDQLEQEKKTIENSLSDTSITYDNMLTKSTRLEIVIELIDEKSFRWMELDELAE